MQKLALHFNTIYHLSKNSTCKIKKKKTLENMKKERKIEN